MGFLKKSKMFAKRFSDNDQGTMAMICGVCTTVIIIAIGASYDVQQLSRAKSLAQSAADSMALSVSTAVGNDDENRYESGKWYEYKEIGGTNGDFTHSIKGRVEYDFDKKYTENKNLVHAHVVGTYNPVFLSILGKAGLEFSADTDATFAQKSIKTASIALVLDNSGSMNWDDANGINKIDGLKSTLNNLMTTLGEITEAETHRILRTGMIPFSDRNINYFDKVCKIEKVQVIDKFAYYTFKNRVLVYVPPVWHYEDKETCKYQSRKITNNSAIFIDTQIPIDWGTISSEEISSLFANGGTNPSGALNQANQWMKLEALKHESESKEVDPLKFVILMADGANNKTSISTAALRHCTWMKTAGVEIFTVGYNLKAGRQYQDGQPTWYNVSQSTVDKAHSFLSSCATDSDHYIQAKDTHELNKAFQNIGEKIVHEVVRLKS